MLLPSLFALTKSDLFVKIKDSKKRKDVRKMTKIDIFSGFLGAGKTTLIKKLLEEAYKGERVVLIENEFGEIGIDGGFLKDAGIEITEMNSGCICCSLVGDFGVALKKVITEFTPDRILIEPSGVGKLSDVIKAVCDIKGAEICLNSATAVVDAKKCKMYMKNFGEFYNNQVESAACIVLSHTTDLADDKINTCVELLKEKNPHATIVTTPWEDLDGVKILEAMEGTHTLESELEEMKTEHHHHHDEHCECGHHHDHEHHHDEHCECGHNHDHEHHHDEHCECGHHHDHEHHHDEHCECGHHHDHEHHHADDVFVSWGCETTAKYTIEFIENALESLENEKEFGMVLRAKGIVAERNGKWIHFDYVPGEADVRYGAAEVTGRLCVIGAELKKDAVEKLFSID